MNNLLARGLTACSLPETLKQIYHFCSAKKDHCEYESSPNGDDALRMGMNSNSCGLEVWNSVSPLTDCNPRRFCDIQAMLYVL